MTKQVYLDADNEFMASDDNDDTFFHIHFWIEDQDSANPIELHFGDPREDISIYLNLDEAKLMVECLLRYLKEHEE